MSPPSAGRPPASCCSPSAPSLPAPQAGPWTAALPFAIDEHGYGAAVTTLLALLLVLAGIGVVLAGVVALRVRRTSTRWSHAAVRVVALWWWFAAGSALVVWTVLVVSPRAL
jgi:hypothetical protein